MIAAIKRWLAPPVFPEDESKTRRAGLLSVVLLNIMTLVPVLVLGNVLGGRTPLPVLGADVAALALCWGLYAWMRKGWVREASIGLLAFPLILITVSVASLGTIRTPSTAMYMLVVISAGLLFDMRGMIAAIALCSVIIGGLIVAENAMFLPPPDYTVTITQWVAYIAIFGWAGSLTLSAVRSMQQALARADRALAERRQTETALRQSEERFRTLVNSMDDVIFTLDSEQRHTGVFGPWVARAGLTPEFFLGRSARDIFGAEAAAVHEAASTRALAGEPVVYEWSVPGVDGPLHYQTSVSPMRDSDGQVTGIVGVGRDITERKRAEEKLRESEARYCALAEAAPDMVFVIGRDDRVQYVNALGASQFGATPEQVIGKPRVDLFPPDIAGRQAQSLRQVFDSGQPLFNESPLRFGGREMWVSNWLVPMRDESGEVTAVMGISRDITEHKRAQEKLRESEARYRQLVDNSPIGIYRTTPDGRILASNPALVKMLGFSSFEELSKRNLEQGDADATYSRRLFKERLEREGAITGLEAEWRRRDGSLIVVRENARAVRGKDGALLYYDGTAEDITEYKRMEEVIQRERDFALSVMNAMGQGVTVTGPDLRFVYVNAAYAHMIGYEPGELIGKQPHEVSLPESHAALDEAWARRQKGETNTYETRLQHKDGRAVPVMVTGVPRQQDGRVMGTVAVITDLTEIRKAEDKIKASLAEKEAMLKEIHHRVKNNLQVISSLLNLQALHTADPEGVEALREGQNRVRAMALIHERLYRQGEFAQVDFTVYVRDLAAFLFRSYSADPSAIKLEVEAEGEVKFDAESAAPCGLILNELISNALKHAFPNGRRGTVKIGLRCDEAGRRTLEVRDDGVGLPDGFGLRTSQTLGMQLIVTLVEQIGGVLEVENNGGAAFRVKF